MNTNKFYRIISQYKENFNEIHQEEIYKWQAFKCFQDNWDINAGDFAEMLERSLAEANNLLDSGNYFPRQMLINNSEKSPEAVKSLFQNLFNEEANLINRVDEYLNKFSELNERNFPGENDFQDHRAISVYLSMKYPDRYYLYKFTMVKKFMHLIDYPYTPIAGRNENLTQYFTLCELLNEKIQRDNSLIDLHKTRITDDVYFDGSLHLLTQDIIFAATNYFRNIEQEKAESPTIQRLTISKRENPISQEVEINFKGRYTNHIENERENKRIGNLGELLVFQYEKEKLKNSGLNKKPEHVAKSQGDGLGYDILSYDENGDKMYIEVKTTRGNRSSPFYLTGNELERSIQDKKIYYLYRLYNFSEETNEANCEIIEGSLANLAINPTKYKVILA